MSDVTPDAEHIFEVSERVEGTDIRLSHFVEFTEEGVSACEAQRLRLRPNGQLRSGQRDVDRSESQYEASRRAEWREFEERYETRAPIGVLKRADGMMRVPSGLVTIRVLEKSLGNRIYSGNELEWTMPSWYNDPYQSTRPILDLGTHLSAEDSESHVAALSQQINDALRPQTRDVRVTAENCTQLPRPRPPISPVREVLGRFLTAFLLEDGNEIFTDKYRSDCGARATYIGMKLAKFAPELAVQKMFVHGSLRNKSLGSQGTLWGFHVAVLVEGADGAWILDPAFEPVPMRPSEWIMKFAARPVSFDVTHIGQELPIRNYGFSTRDRSDLLAHTDRYIQVEIEKAQSRSSQPAKSTVEDTEVEAPQTPVANSAPLLDVDETTTAEAINVRQNFLLNLHTCWTASDPADAESSLTTPYSARARFPVALFVQCNPKTAEKWFGDRSAESLIRLMEDHALGRKSDAEFHAATAPYVKRLKALGVAPFSTDATI